MALKTCLHFGPPILFDKIPPNINPNKGERTIENEYDMNI